MPPSPLMDILVDAHPRQQGEILKDHHPVEPWGIGFSASKMMAPLLAVSRPPMIFNSVAFAATRVTDHGDKLAL
jgi:hypothetical protein